MIFTRDFVTRENHCQITSLVTKKSLFTVTHALFFISYLTLYVGCNYISMLELKLINYDRKCQDHVS